MWWGAEVAKFEYVATGPDGRRTSGIQRAATRDAAEHALYQRNLRGIRVTEKRSVMQTEIGGSKVKRDEVMHLSRQLSAFVRAGLPLIEAVHTLGVESGNPSLRRTMADVEQGLHRGDSLSTCFDRHPRSFPAYYRGILRSAELTGHLDTVLDQLAKYLERDLEARRRIKQAMIYPAMIAALALFTVVVLAGFVLPRFRTFFEGLDAELPLAPRILLAITDFVLGWWWAVLGGVAAVILIVLLALQSKAGRYAWDRMLLGLPIIGGTIRFALVERFCRVLASMAAAGVALPEALRVATESLRNRVFIRSLSRVNEEMLEGQGLAVPLSRTRLFPGTAARMIRVGEETGTLETQLEVTARYYESELDYKLKKLTAIFEPAIIIAVGLVVGFVAVAMVSAMYGIFGQVGL
jgi:type IV pilus assembly protein PilC